MTVTADIGPRPPGNGAGAQHLDPADPLVVDTRALGRRPGAMRRLERSVPAPPGLSVELVRVSDPAHLELDLRLESVVEGVLVSGTVRAPVTAECSRCLDPVAQTIEVDVQQLYTYGGGPTGSPPGRRPSEEDEETEPVYGDLLDLTRAVRDAVILGMPLRPLCRPDCPGLCATCGARLADVGAEHRHEQLDPRWAALADALTRRTPSAEHPATTSDHER
jgi:uncharacterized protein